MIINIVGARPNFMKMASVINAINNLNIPNLLVHTGQHYDDNMSKVFIDELEMPVPDIFLGVGSGTHAESTARIMVEFEKICLDNNPNLVIVAGDVNSTLACALTAKKLNISIAHVESGLRSFDNTMPEEINRILKVGNCFPCHEKYNDPIYQDMKKSYLFAKTLEHRNLRARILNQQ